MSTYALSDVHGNFKALKEVLTLSGFDYDEDKLIILGDVCDGHNKTKECVEELLKIKHRVFVLGNHDEFLRGYLRDMDCRPHTWIYQGGAQTLLSYTKGIPKSHIDFFLNEPVPYHIEEGMLFVHGGLGDNDAPQFCSIETLTWDRSMINRAKTRRVGHWPAIFVGHTTTQGLGNDYWATGLKGKPVPLQYNNVWCLDAGGGYDGKICMMDIHSKKYWLSKKSKAFDIK